MKGVLMGKSMLAKIAQEIEKGIRQDDLMQSFISTSLRLFKSNVYFLIVTHGMSKLGNDSATGLRRLRHLGAVQVSMNPVIAARAYNERPSLWDRFIEVAKTRPDLLRNPEEHSDELALTATVTVFLPNLLTFRPIALLSDLHDGLVSYQLNPHYGTNVEASLDDATKIYAMLGEELQKYDSQLLWNPNEKKPNIVFKVPACSPEAIEITSRLNALGIGTNNTVTFTVAQEVTLIMAAMRGLSQALKKQISIGQVYETNMIGRLEDHLREAEGERLLRQSLESENGEKRLQTLLNELEAVEAVNASSQDRAVTIACSKKYLRNLADKRFVKALSESTNSENIEPYLSQLEDDIQHAGILVTRKTYAIFFAPENRQKWRKYMQDEFGLTQREAEESIDKIDLLPASKRRARDTYLVLGERGLGNLTNTEFPNQQLAVWETSNTKDFRLQDFERSIMTEPDPKMLQRLLRIKDFQLAYELTPELAQELNELGIKGKFGEHGLKPEHWVSYGPVRKTMLEFSDAYDDFKRKVIDVIKRGSSTVKG
jgi:transaldolase